MKREPFAPVDLLVLALASHRFTRIVTTDDLPPLERARNELTLRVEKRWGQRWAEGLGCDWCVGFWVAALTTLLARSSRVRRLLIWPAISSAVGLLASWEET